MARVKRGVGRQAPARRPSSRRRAITATRAVRSAPPTSRSCTAGSTRSATGVQEGRVPSPVDPADQRRLPAARPELQPVHRRPHTAGIEVDRKVLADLAVTDPAAFGALVEDAQGGPPSVRGLALHQPPRPTTAAPARAPQSASDEGAFVVEGPTLIARRRRRRVEVEARTSRRRARPGGGTRRRCSAGGRRDRAGGRPRSPAAGARRRPLPTAAHAGRAGSSSSPTASPIPATSARSCARPRRPASTPWSLTPGTVDAVQSEGRAGLAGALFHVPVSTDVGSTTCARPGCGWSARRRTRVGPHRRRLDPVARDRRRQRSPRLRRRHADRRVGDDPARVAPRASTWRWPPRCSASKSPASAARGPPADARLIWRGARSTRETQPRQKRCRGTQARQVASRPHERDTTSGTRFRGPRAVPGGQCRSLTLTQHLQPARGIAR